MRQILTRFTSRIRAGPGHRVSPRQRGQRMRAGNDEVGRRARARVAVVGLGRRVGCQWRAGREAVLRVSGETIAIAPALRPRTPRTPRRRLVLLARVDTPKALGERAGVGGDDDRRAVVVRGRVRRERAREARGRREMDAARGGRRTAGRRREGAFVRRLKVRVRAGRARGMGRLQYGPWRRAVRRRRDGHGRQ